MSAGRHRECRNARAVRQSATHHRIPCHASVRRFIDTCTSDGAGVRSQSCVDDPRVLEVVIEIRCAGRTVHRQHACPRTAAIRRAIDPALAAAAAPALSRDERRVGVPRRHDDRADELRRAQADICPRCSAVGGLEHAGAGRERPTGCVARSDVDRGRLGGRDRDRADRRDMHVVEDRRPRRAAVRRLPHTAGGGAGVVGRRVARYAGRGGDVARARRSNRTPAHVGEIRGFHLLRRGARPGAGERGGNGDGQADGSANAHGAPVGRVGSDGHDCSFQ